MINQSLSEHYDTLKWLAFSKIRREDGGYYSEYDPKKRKFSCWGDGNSCTLSTAGAILTFLRYGKYLDKALISGEHLINIILDSSHRYFGLIPSGASSKTSRCYASSIACQALLDLFELTKEEKYLNSSLRIANAMIKHMINKDGSLRREVVIKKGIHFRFFFNLLKPIFLWDLESFLIFKRLYQVTKEAKYLNTYRKIIYWALKNRNRDATIYFGKINLPFLLHLSTQKTLSEIKANFKGWFTRYHPTALNSLLKIYIESKKINEALKLTNWLLNHLGPNGLLFQWYFTDGGHSEEEDVMPTAQLGLIIMENEDKFPSYIKDYIEIIYKGLLKAKINSEDPNIDGAYKGLPYDPKRGDRAFTWDTIYALLFFHKYHKRF